MPYRWTPKAKCRQCDGEVRSGLSLCKACGSEQGATVADVTDLVDSFDPVPVVPHFGYRPVSRRR